MAAGCRYDEAGPWDGGAHCSGSFSRGARELGEFLVGAYGGSYGGYSCRPNTADTSQMSVHGTGRAIDVFPQSRAEGDMMAKLLTDHHVAWGIQLIVWWYRDWRCGVGWTPYGGPHSHTDHLHCELTRTAAANNTAYTYNQEDEVRAEDIDAIRTIVQNNREQVQDTIQAAEARIKAEVESENRATRRAILDYEEAVVSVTGTSKAAIRAKLQPATLAVINVVD